MIAVPVEYRISGLGTASRLIVFGASSVLGMGIQILMPSLFWVGTLLLILPQVLLIAKPWTNKPKDKGEEDWQAVGEAELDRIAESFKSSRRIKIPLWYRPLSGLPFTLVLGILWLFSLRSPFSLFWLDALILLWPTLHFLRIVLWIPRDFEMIVRSLQAARSVVPPKDLTITPYLRLDRDDTGLRIPEDARLLVESRRKKDDLVGIQIQGAINSGPNGKVPYLYAVVLTHGKGPSWKGFSDYAIPGYVVEAGGDDTYGTVVIRQKTEGGGYHTTEADCERLMRIVCNLLAEKR